MSENLDLVRSIFADWERGDWGRADWADPEIDFEFMDGPSPSVAKGVGEMARMWADVLSTFDEYRANVTDMREIDHERVLVLTEASGITGRSRMPIPEEWNRGASVYRVCDGKVFGIQVWFDRANALANLGLEE
jgi:hypothetical protein